MRRFGTKSPIGLNESHQIAVMLSEAKHLWSIFVMKDTSKINPEILRFAQNDKYEMVSRKPRGFICL
jgi:hypothetical protein